MALFLLLIFTGGFSIYVLIVNRNSPNMTIRQKILKAAYPAMMWFAKKTGKNTLILKGTKAPVVSIYTLDVVLNNNTPLSLSTLKGKKILLVNTASDCGYTGQYDGLEKLYQQYKDKLVVIGFPANDFKEQEKLDDAQIASFCKVNFGVTFPLAQKSIVLKQSGQNEIFEWLTDKTKNGWNSQTPTWNFCKYLVNENGTLTHFFSSSVEPLSPEVVDAILK
jgi:glutathione peroxidase